MFATFTQLVGVQLNDTDKLPSSLQQTVRMENDLYDGLQGVHWQSNVSTKSVSQAFLGISPKVGIPHKNIFSLMQTAMCRCA